MPSLRRLLGSRSRLQTGRHIRLPAGAPAHQGGLRSELPANGVNDGRRVEPGQADLRQTYGRQGGDGQDADPQEHGQGVRKPQVRAGAAGANLHPDEPVQDDGTPVCVIISHNYDWASFTH